MSQPISRAALAAQKALIKSCASIGVEIAYLPDAPNFRFVPPPTLPSLPETGAPSRRKGHSIKCRNAKCVCKRSKWFKHARLENGADYFQPMRGDAPDLTEARAEYHKGNPVPLRNWLGASAPERAATWREIDLALPLPVTDKMSKEPKPVTAEQLRDFRLALDWTQEQLASWGGVHVRTIIRFERGDQPVPEIWRKALQGLHMARTPNAKLPF